MKERENSYLMKMSAFTGRKENNSLKIDVGLNHRPLQLLLSTMPLRHKKPSVAIKSCFCLHEDITSISDNFDSFSVFYTKGQQLTDMPTRWMR